MATGTDDKYKGYAKASDGNSFSFGNDEDEQAELDSISRNDVEYDDIDGDEQEESDGETNGAGDWKRTSRKGGGGGATATEGMSDWDAAMMAMDEEV